MEKKLRQKKSNCIKIVLFGPESTGKTTLAKQLAVHYNSLWVPEYSRVYAEKQLENGIELTKKDVLPIALGQMELEQKYIDKSKQLLFFDTNLLETKVYSEYLYNGYCPDILKEHLDENYYDLYFLTDIDVPWEYDPVRASKSARKQMFLSFKNELEAQGVPYITLSGSKEVRFNTAIMQVDMFLEK